MCLVADFISGNHNLLICQEFDNNWEQDFLSGSSTSSKRPQNDGDPGSGDEEAASDDDDGEGGDDELVCLERQPNISTIQQAISSLEDVYSFLDRKGHTSLAGSTMMLISNLAEAHRSSIAADRLNYKNVSKAYLDCHASWFTIFKIHNTVTVTYNSKNCCFLLLYTIV